MKTKKTCEKCGQPYETTLEAFNILRTAGMANECPACLHRKFRAAAQNASINKLDSTTLAFLDVARIATV